MYLLLGRIQSAFNVTGPHHLQHGPAGVRQITEQTRRMLVPMRPPHSFPYIHMSAPNRQLYARTSRHIYDSKVTQHQVSIGIGFTLKDVHYIVLGIIDLLARLHHLPSQARSHNSRPALA